MLNEAKKEQVHSGSYLGDILLELFKKKFPEAQVSTRPSRLLKAAERIAAPLSNQRIDASSLSNYLEKNGYQEFAINKVILLHYVACNMIP